MTPTPAGPPAPRRPGRRRRIAVVLLLGLLLTFVLANVLADQHAYAFTHYAPAGDPPPKPESLSVGQKLGLAVSGVPVPRPENRNDPSAVGVGFTTVRIDMPAGEHVEGWLADWPAARGIVVMGHGYMTCKSTLLAEGRAIHDMGFAVLWIDFRGSGGSSRSDCTLGVREGEDMAAALRYAERTFPGRPVVAYGFSMGAAAVLKAVAVHGSTPTAVVLECPFDTMTNAVRARVRSLGLPAFPAAEMVVFWGGRRVGIDGFAHSPSSDAASITCPALVTHGDADMRATPDMVAAVADRLAGPKQTVPFAGAEHQSLVRFDGDRWRSAVGGFLTEHVR